MTTLFVYDDVRSIHTALERCRPSMAANRFDVCVLVRPFRHDGDAVVADHANALDVIQHNAAFSVWVLDNDLAPGLEGLDFLKQVARDHPHKMPEQVYSCSSNFDRRRQIESFFADWVRVVRPPHE